ncbi:MAG: hypothetical protein JNJ60_00510 [Rhodocyclaceae bacterium]|nr:hypothetical protein [Rhodocyclaceae bacterium]
MTGAGPPRDTQLSALYRAAAAEQPPAALDARVLEAARAEVRRSRRGWRRWTLPLAVFSSLVLTVSISLQVWQQQGPDGNLPARPAAEALPKQTAPAPAAAPEAPAAAPAAPAPGPRDQAVPQPARPPARLQQAPPPRKAAAPEADAAPGAPVEARAARPAPAPAAADAPQPFPAPQAGAQPAGSAVGAAAKQAAPADVPPMRATTAQPAQRSVPALAAPPVAQERKEHALEQTPEAAAVRPAAPAGAPAAQFEMQDSTSARKREDLARPAAAAEEQKRKDAHDAQARIARIRELRDAGRTDEARTELDRFKRDFPAYALPADLR